MTFLVRGANGKIYTQMLSSGFAVMPWYCIGQPAAALQAASGATFFGCQGADHSLFRATYNGTGWSVLAEVGNTLIGGPGTAATSAEPQWLAEGVDHAVWAYTFGGGWISLGGSVAGGVGAVALN